jgi:hypothetical protein
MDLGNCAAISPPRQLTYRYRVKTASAVVAALMTVLTACQGTKAEREDLRGTMWVAPIGDSVNANKAHVLLEFADSTATMTPLYAEALKYAIVRDTILVLTSQGTIRFTAHGDSLTDESFGWVFYRAK